MKIGKTMSESKDIVVEYSGWCKLQPQNASFVYIGQDDDEHRINGLDWLNLSEEKKADYILEDVVAAIRDSFDGSWEHIDVMEEEPV